MLPRPPTSPLFPYTTLFRSNSSSPDERNPDPLWSPIPRTAEVNTTAVHPNPNHTRSTRSEEHTSELQSRGHLVCRLLLEKKKKQQRHSTKRTTQKDT